MKAYSFEYSEEFKKMIVDLHLGQEKLPNYQKYISAHLGGPGSRLCHFHSHLYPEIVYHCGDLSQKRIMDFGCGTGATTVVLALHAKSVVAYDIDQRGISICKRRLEEHNLIHNVTFFHSRSLKDIIDKMGTFDFILLNGVVEHIPLSKRSLRKEILLDLFGLLNPGGYLYISETPNRLWPFDRHTTQLWWIPWTKPGCRWAYLKAVKMNRHYDNPMSHSDGVLGLEERGAWGATYFEIKRYFSGQPIKVINTLPGHNRHLTYSQYSQKQLSTKRRLFDFIVYYLFTKWTKIPILALAPMLDHLVIQKRSSISI